MNEIPLKGYYSQSRHSGCYGAALANLLVSLGDTDTARKVFDNYPTYELVGRDGVMHVGVATRTLRDIAGGQYEGILHLGITNLEGKCKEEIFGDIKDLTLKALKEEMSAGRVRYHAGPLAHDNHSSLYWIQRSSGGGHWIVPNIEEDSYIDNGMLKWPLEDLEVIGVLKLRKVNLH